MAKKSVKKGSSKKSKSKGTAPIYLDSYEAWLQKEVNKRLKKR